MLVEILERCGPPLTAFALPKETAAGTQHPMDFIDSFRVIFGVQGC